MDWTQENPLKRVNAEGLDEEEFLKAYDAHQYQNPPSTVDNLLFTVREKNPDNYRKNPQKTLQVLLIRRKDHPYIGQWALPGGFVHIGEPVKTAALRELKEETHLENIYLEQLYTWGDEYRDDPRGDFLSISYMALTDSYKLLPVAGDDAEDAEDAQWFSVEKKESEMSLEKSKGSIRLSKEIELRLTNEALQEVVTATILSESYTQGAIRETQLRVIERHGLAFDHGRIIYYGLQRLANKLNYTPIVFNLLPERFTLNEIHALYEIILDKKITYSNFRRDILKAGQILETKVIEDNAGHRPARCYTFNPG